MVLTSSARCGGSFFWTSPSNRRLPICPGTGASSQLDRPEETSQASKCCLPPPRRYRAYSNRSIARVPTAPAASPRPTAPSGVPAVFRPMSLQDLIGTVQDWFTAVLLSRARERGFGAPQDPHEGVVPIRTCRVERSRPPEVP